MERLSLIDVAAEDDFLESSPCDRLIDQISPGILENNAGSKIIQSVTVGSEEGVDQNGTSKVAGQALELSESPKKKQTKSGKCNLRKSLAWDNAFFTSEGVLDHEELAVMNSTFKKIETRSLPAILEDTRKSSESTSTLDNDNWELETLQVDLFENIRASIQKTHGTAGKVVKLADPTRKIIPGSTKVEPSSHNKKNSPGLGNQHREHARRGAVVAVNTTGTDRITSSKILSKPPKVMPRTTPAVPTKASLVPGISQIRTSTTEMPVTQKSGGFTRKTSKGSSSASSKSSQYTKALKPTLNIANNTEDKANKSPQQITRMKSTSRTSIRSSSGSILNRASTRASVAKIVGKTKSSPAMSPNSFAKSLTISPSSSFDSVASGSSSSTFLAVKSSVHRIDCSSSSPSLEGADSDRVYSPGLRSYFNSEDRRDNSCRLDSTKNSPDSCAQIEPSIENNLEYRPTSSSGAKCYRPSGLKLPTPKIGYFDAKKSPVSNDKTSQTRQQLVFPRSTKEVSKTDSTSKLKLSNFRHIAVSSDSPKIQSAAQSHKPFVESNDLTATTETHSKIHPIGEDLYSPSDSSARQLTKPRTKVQDGGDLHPEHVEAIPIEAAVLLGNSCSPIRKQVEMVCCGEEAVCQKNHHSDSSTIEMEKENISPAE